MHGSQYRPPDRVNASMASVKMPRLTSSRVSDERTVAEECPVALVYDGTTVAVLMSSPTDLIDLAIGFGLTEGIVREAREIDEINVVPGADGIELRMWLRADRGRSLKERQRRLVGPTGCGLCGIESLQQAKRINPPVEREIFLTPGQICTSVEALAACQVLNRETRATHAAGFFVPDDGTMIVREDVGRHNALDKLAGALVAADISGCNGAVVLTSRISVEMVQKAAALGSGIVVAISAPTALAIRTAEEIGRASCRERV